MVRNSASMANGGEGPSTSASTSTPATTLDGVMRAPAVVAPDVVVLETMHEDKERKRGLNPKEDLWLTSADGRYNSPIIPLHVGTAPHSETFYYVNCSFAEDDKGKGVQGGEDEESGAGSESDSSGIGILSDSSTALSRRRRERRRRHQQDRYRERLQEKHPGSHRPGCACYQCVIPSGPPCWNCGAPRPPPPPLPPHHLPIVADRPRPTRNPRRPALRADRRRVPSPPLLPPPPPPPAPLGEARAADPNNNNNNSNSNSSSSEKPSSPEQRISGADLRTWLLAFEQSIDVYICANKFLLEDFKRAVARVCVDMLETAGPDAAQVEVLALCRRLYEGVPESDRLLRAVAARAGFLQPQLFRRAPREALAFLHAHPEVSALLLREMGSRREEDIVGAGAGAGAGSNYPHLQLFPPMERPLHPPPPPFDPHGRPLPPIPRARW